MGILNPHSLQLFATYFCAMGILWYAFTLVYLWVTPYDDLKAIREGSIAPAVCLAGADIGFILPVITASYVGKGIIEFIAWGIFSGIVQAICFALLYRRMPGEIEKGNVAASIIFASASITLGLINAFAMIP